jgi:hypothetical protein
LQVPATVMSGLLASGNGRGNGDMPEDWPWVGRWAGCRVMLAPTGHVLNKGASIAGEFPPEMLRAIAEA